MNIELVLHHTAEIAKHAKAIEELKKPVSHEGRLEQIMIEGRCRMWLAIERVIDRHMETWRVEQMAALLKTEEILARMEPDPWEQYRGMQWTNEQMDALRRGNSFRTKNVARAMYEDFKNQRMTRVAHHLAEHRGHRDQL